MSNRNPTWLALVAALAVGCGGDAGDGAADGGGEDAAQADADPAVDPAVAATVSGTVTFTGTAPEPTSIDMSEEPVCAEKHTEPPTFQPVQAADGNLANVFVFVSEGLGDEVAMPSAEPTTLDQNGCRYRPHVLGIQVGENLVIRNSDDVLHNINTESTANRPFNISQPQAGMETARSFSTPEVMIPVKCDVHGWMSAFIGVTGHGHHAVTGEDGSFTIEGLPPGDYVIEAWHETLGAQTMNVSVGEAETGTADFTYDSDTAYDPVPMGEPLIVGHDAHAEHGAG
ncbi:MAG: carboxypeptidase regulatory-like domain-containing protein [Gemmatimonadota bacterium]